MKDKFNHLIKEMTEAVEILIQGKTRNVDSFDFSKKIKELKDKYKCETKYEIKEQSEFSSTWSRSQLGNTVNDRPMEIELSKDGELKVNNLPGEYEQFWMGLWRKDTGGDRTDKYSMNIPEPFKITLGSTASNFQDKNVMSWIRATTTNNNSTSVGKDINDNPLYLQNGDSASTNKVDSFKKYLKQGGIYWLYLFTGKPTSSSSTNWENKAILSYLVQNKLNLTFPGQNGDDKIKPEKFNIANMPIDSDNGYLAFYDTDPEYNLGEFYGSHFSNIKPTYEGFSYVQWTNKADDSNFVAAGKNADNTIAYASSKTKIGTKNLNEDLGLEYFFEEVVNTSKSQKKYVYYIDDGGNKKDSNGDATKRGIIEEGKNIALNIPMGKWVIESTICTKEQEGTYEPGSEEKIKILDEINTQIIKLQDAKNKAEAKAAAVAEDKTKDEKIQSLTDRLSEFLAEEKEKNDKLIQGLISKAKKVEKYLNKKEFATKIEVNQISVARQDIEEAEEKKRIIDILLRRANIVKNYLNKKEFATNINVDEISVATQDIAQAEKKKRKKENKTINFDFTNKKIKVGNDFPNLNLKGKTDTLNILSNNPGFRNNWEENKQAWGELGLSLYELTMYEGEWITINQSENSEGNISITVSSKFIITNAYFILKDDTEKKKFANDDKGNFALGINDKMENKEIHIYDGEMKEFSEIFKEIYFETGIQTNIIYSHTETSESLNKGGNRISLQVNEYNKFRETENVKTLDEIKGSIDTIGGDFNNNDNFASDDRNILTTAIIKLKNIADASWNIWKNLSNDEQANKQAGPRGENVSQEVLVLTRYLDKNGEFVKDDNGNFKLKVHPACIYGQQLNRLKTDIDNMVNQLKKTNENDAVAVKAAEAEKAKAEAEKAKAEAEKAKAEADKAEAEQAKAEADQAKAEAEKAKAEAEKAKAEAEKAKAATATTTTTGESDTDVKNEVENYKIILETWDKSIVNTNWSSIIPKDRQNPYRGSKYYIDQMNIENNRFGVAKQFIRAYDSFYNATVQYEGEKYIKTETKLKEELETAKLAEATANEKAQSEAVRADEEAAKAKIAEEDLEAEEKRVKTLEDRVIQLENELVDAEEGEEEAEDKAERAEERAERAEKELNEKLAQEQKDAQTDFGQEYEYPARISTQDKTSDEIKMLKELIQLKKKINDLK